LGLSIVRTIAQQHNGSVNAMSQPAQGSQFEVTLPIYR
jgi:signal transduction histidine kinase